ncbi:MAG: Fe-S-containing protein [Helicobacteraceae bacterium]|jgi:uncharacterized membrane protein|nr:Fe-S-containing protein [Helicobacteraceae bacterium]
MLHYLVNVTDTLFFPAVLIGVVLGIYAGSVKGKAMLIGAALGATIALAAALIRQFEPKALTREYYDLAILIPMVVFLMALAIVTALRLHIEKISVASNIVVFAVLLLTLAYSLTDIFIYPFEFLNGLDSFYDKEFALRVFGYAAALLILLTLCGAVYSVSRGAPTEILVFCAVSITLLIAFDKLLSVLSIFYSRKMLPDYGWLTSAIFFLISNSQSVIFYLVCGLTALISLSLYLWDRMQAQEGANPAITRKLIADSRRRRRLSFLTVFSLFLAALSLNGGAWLSEQNIELSPLIEVKDIDGVISFSLDEFDDGHLRRYVYKTKNGIDVKFLIIKKKRGGYGVGLDACEICGVAGYYEKNDRVICSRCSVAINIATIGFYGGCNPIPFPYEITNSMLHIYISALEKEENRFR